VFNQTRVGEGDKEPGQDFTEPLRVRLPNLVNYCIILIKMIHPSYIIHLCRLY
jgi:hypothetical protein